MNELFDSIYGGQFEMDEVGFAGTPVENRRPSNDDLVTVYREAQEFAELMDRTTFDHFER